MRERERERERMGEGKNSNSRANSKNVFYKDYNLDSFGEREREVEHELEILQIIVVH